MPSPTPLPASTCPIGTPGNVIGGTVAGARNVISGNYYGVYLAGPGSGGNLVEGNYIGVTPDGTRAVGSAFAGVIIFGGATNNIIGGTAAGAGNVISGFWGYGVYISDAGTSGNLVQGNIIGADPTGTNALGNGYANVVVATRRDQQCHRRHRRGRGQCDCVFRRSRRVGVEHQHRPTTPSAAIPSSATAASASIWSTMVSRVNHIGDADPVRTICKISPSSPMPLATPPARLFAAH